MKSASKIVFKDCFKLKSKESVLIITDKNKREIALSLKEAAEEISKNIFMIEMPVAKVNGQEPPLSIANLMKNFDVIVAVTTKSISHTKARVNACKTGARMATMPGITKDMFKRTIPVNYKEMRKITLKLQRLMDKTNLVKITSKLGTNLTFSIKNRLSLPDYGDLSKKGSFDNLPSGECFIAPVENSANGVYHVDVCMGTGLLKEPVKITMKNGIAIKFEGKYAKEVKDQFKGLPKIAFTIAELGIGTNNKAKTSGKVLEDEKILGTCHIALGNNKGFGGKNDVPIHIDGVINKPNIYFDNKLIMDSGKLLI